MSDQGWIKLHRELMDKAIWIESTPEQKVILITLLMMANHKEKEWEWKGQKYTAKPGQFVTSLNSISKKCGTGISTQNIRTALKRFEKYEFLTNESTKQNRLITIVNWQVYQAKESETNKAINNQLTNDQQRPNNHLTTNKNDKNDKNVKNDDIDAKIQNFYSQYEKITNKKSIINPLSKIRIEHFINEHGVEILKQSILEIKKSDYLKSSSEINWVIQNLEKITNGVYRNKEIKTKFHNFEGQSEKYNIDELDKIALERTRRRNNE